MDNRIKLGISSCLLGEKVRFDGGHKLNHYLTETLGQYVEWVPVCPEVESGLPVPREAMRLIGKPEAPRLVTSKSGVDLTDRMLTWAKSKLKHLESRELCGFIFKSKSPSSGMQRVKVYPPSGIPSSGGTGIFARAFMEHFPLLPVEDEGRLFDPVLRENFIERVFVYKRWQEFKSSGGSTGKLVSFHTGIKLLVLSHSPKHYSILGRLVADAKKVGTSRLHAKYISNLMDGLRLIATQKKHSNVLHHIMGYFKKQLSPDEKQELLEVIHRYHSGLIPLIVPVVLINHYVRKYNEPYLQKQVYLNPHPLELHLRNHV